jgi:hypothetical protein
LPPFEFDKLNIQQNEIYYPDFFQGNEPITWVSGYVSGFPNCRDKAGGQYALVGYYCVGWGRAARMGNALALGALF